MNTLLIVLIFAGIGFYLIQRDQMMAQEDNVELAKIIEELSPAAPKNEREAVYHVMKCAKLFAERRTKNFYRFYNAMNFNLKLAGGTSKFDEEYIRALHTEALRFNRMF